jgi:hypothetical protein
MSRSPERLSTVVALRPWPFGPPLRGRAPRNDGAQRAARRLSVYGLPTRQAPAPTEGLAHTHPLCCALSRACLSTTKKCQTQIRT